MLLPVSEDKFREFMQDLGRTSRGGQLRFLAYLPAVEAGAYHRKWGFESLEHFAAVVGSVEKAKVMRVRRLYQAIGRYDCLWNLLIEGKVFSKLETIAPHVRNQEDALAFSKYIEGHSKRSLEALVVTLPTSRRAKSKTSKPATAASQVQLAPQCWREEGDDSSDGDDSDASGAERDEASKRTDSTNMVRLRMTARGETLLRRLRAWIVRDERKGMSLGSLVQRLVEGELHRRAAAEVDLAASEPSEAEHSSAGDGQDGPEAPAPATLAQLDRLAPYILLVYRSEGKRNDWTPTVRGGRTISNEELARRRQVGEALYLEELEQAARAAARRAAERGEETAAERRRSGATRRGLPAASRRQVVFRSGALCETPGCRRLLEDIHHRDPVGAGGGDEPENLAGLCSVHHELAHSPLRSLPGCELPGEGDDGIDERVRASRMQWVA